MRSVQIVGIPTETTALSVVGMIAFIFWHLIFYCTVHHSS